MVFRSITAQKPPSNRILFFLVIFACAFFIRAPLGWSETAQLNWNPNSETNLDGYRVYYGMAPLQYDQNMDVGPITNHDVTGLLPGVIYYFSVTAYNTGGFESGFSNEATHVSENATVVTGPLATIIITPASASIRAGFGQQFAAVAKDAQAIQLSNIGFTWTSSDPAVATISGTGFATGVSMGNTVITASSDGVVGNQVFLQVTPVPDAIPPGEVSSGEVTASPAETGPAAIEVSPFSVSIAEGFDQQFAAVVKDNQGIQISGINPTWFSSDPNVAGIDADGLSSAVSSGTTEIYAMSGPVTSNRISLQVVRGQQSFQMSGGGCGFIRMKGGRLPDTRQIATNLAILFAPLLLRTAYKQGRQIIRMKRQEWLELFGVWNGLRVATVSLGVFLFAVMTQEVFTFVSLAI